MRARTTNIGPAPTLAAAVSTDPAVVGRWTPKFSIPGIAVHTVVPRTGKIIYFTGTTQGRAYLLDPIARTTRAVHPPRIAEGENEPANIFCAGSRSSTTATSHDFVTLLSNRDQQDQPPAGGLYPHTFQMPSGRVLVAGPEPADSWFFHLSRIGSLSWEDAPNPLRHSTNDTAEIYEPSYLFKGPRPSISSTSKVSPTATRSTCRPRPTPRRP